MTDSKTIPTELLDTLLSGYQKPEDLMGESGLLKQLTKALLERALEAEMTEHKKRFPKKRFLVLYCAFCF